MNNVETASLVLSTLIPDYHNYNQTITTWNNLNLKNILGTMYDRYDKFNIELVSVSQFGTDFDFGESVNDTNISIQLSGLPFVNNNYSLINKHNTNSTIIAAYQFVQYDNINTTHYKNCVRTFIKDSNYIINLTLTYLGCNLEIVNSPVLEVLDANGDPVLDDDGVPELQGIYPNMVFMFNIYGIPNDKNNHNGSRMQISN
jgi:hypothetical protein